MGLERQICKTPFRQMLTDVRAGDFLTDMARLSHPLSSSDHNSHSRATCSDATPVERQITADRVLLVLRAASDQPPSCMVSNRSLKLGSQTGLVDRDGFSDAYENAGVVNTKGTDQDTS